ncbi:unnamed protein product [Laminaria digitata]
MLASVVFPGFTINRWVAFVEYLLGASDLESQFPGVGGWLPTAAGLALIPFIVAPLDNLVEEVCFCHELDYLFRLVVYICHSIIFYPFIIFITSFALRQCTVHDSVRPTSSILY